MENAGDVMKWCAETDYTGGVGMVTKLYLKEDKIEAFKTFMKEHSARATKERGFIR